MSLRSYRSKLGGGINRGEGGDGVCFGGGWGFNGVGIFINEWFVSYYINI